jgi:hypothetical protein
VALASVVAVGGLGIGSVGGGPARAATSQASVLDPTFGQGTEPGVVALDVDLEARSLLVLGDGSTLIGSGSGRLLTRFDPNGRRVPFGDGLDLVLDQYGTLYDLDVDSQGRILLTFGAMVVRLLPNGAVDPSWNFDLVFDSNNFWVLSRASVDASDRLVLSGLYGDQRPMLARVTTSGSLDESFAAAGDVPGRIRTLAFAQDDPIVDGQGNVFVVGSGYSLFFSDKLVIEKVTSTGVYDADFGAGGLQPGLVAYNGGPSGLGLAAALDGQGRVVMAGNARPPDGPTTGNAVIVRLSTTGQVDQAFVTAATSAASRMQFPRKVAIDADGSIQIAGSFISANGTVDGVPSVMVLDDSGAASATTGWPTSPVNEAPLPGLASRILYRADFDSQGRAVLLVHGSPHTLVRLRAPRPISFVGLVPARLMDTRPEGETVDGLAARGGRVATGSTVQLPVAGRAGVGADASAVSLNVTVTGASAPGFLTVFPCGASQPLASNLNFTSGQAVANAVASKLGSGGTVCVFASTAVDVIVDVNGFHAAGSDYVGLSPARLLDTRPGGDTFDGVAAASGPVAGGTHIELLVAGRGGVAPDAGAVSLNVTVTGALAPGFVTVFPCGVTRPLASSINFGPGQTVPNSVSTPVGAAGRVCLYASTTLDLIADVNGFHPAASDFEPVTPARLFDSRPDGTTVDGLASGGGHLPAGSTAEVPVVGRGGVGTGATTVSLNVTVTDPAAAGFVTVFPCGSTQPLASSVNFGQGATVANAVVSQVGAAGKVCIFGLSQTHVVIDVNGYYD